MSHIKSHSASPGVSLGMGPGISEVALGGCLEEFQQCALWRVWSNWGALKAFRWEFSKESHTASTSPTWGQRRVNCFMIIVVQTSQNRPVLNTSKHPARILMRCQWPCMKRRVLKSLGTKSINSLLLPQNMHKPSPIEHDNFHVSLQLVVTRSKTLKTWR